MTEIILITVFFLSLFVLKIIRGSYEFALAGRIAMAALLTVTAIGHFVFTKGMSMMLPEFIPFKTAVVYLTGVLELAAAIGLCIQRFRVMTGWWLIVFFVLLLPANIYAALNHIDLQHASYNGNGPAYLWFRIPLQLFFIVWTYLSAVRPSAKQNSPAIKKHEFMSVRA